MGVFSMQNVVTENSKIYLCKRYKFIEIFDIKFSCEMFFFLFPDKTFKDGPA